MHVVMDTLQGQFFFGLHASCAFPFQTDSLSSSDMEEVDGGHVENAESDHVSTNPCPVKNQFTNSFSTSSNSLTDSRISPNDF